MTADDAPIEIRRLADQRRAARADRNWAEADRLKAEIEAAGWTIVDQGRAFSLARAHPPDLDEEKVDASAHNRDAGRVDPGEGRGMTQRIQEP